MKVPVRSACFSKIVQSTPCTKFSKSQQGHTVHRHAFLAKAMIHPIDFLAESETTPQIDQSEFVTLEAQTIKTQLRLFPKQVQSSVTANRIATTNQDVVSLRVVKYFACNLNVVLATITIMFGILSLAHQHSSDTKRS